MSRDHSNSLAHEARHSLLPLGEQAVLEKDHRHAHIAAGNSVSGVQGAAYVRQEKAGPYQAEWRGPTYPPLPGHWSGGTLRRYRSWGDIPSLSTLRLRQGGRHSPAGRLESPEIEYPRSAVPGSFRNMVRVPAPTSRSDSGAKWVCSRGHLVIARMSGEVDPR